MMNEFRELEQIHIDLLEKERLKGMESQQEGLVLGASKEDERYCILKT